MAPRSSLRSLPVTEHTIQTVEAGTVSGVIHHPAGPAKAAVALAHGAGSNCHSRLLQELAAALATHGFAVLRYDLAFRRARPTGPPSPSGQPEDVRSIQHAVTYLRDLIKRPVFAGGHSYGGRMTTVAAAHGTLDACGLLLLSYPLHPPRKPEQLRVTHFPQVNLACVFVHGTRDPFGSPDEIGAAIRLIPARTQLTLLEGAGHELRKPAGWTSVICSALEGSLC